MTTITFQGKPLQTSGELPLVGTKAPDFTLVDGKLKDPTCAASTLKFNEKAAHLHNTVVLVISADLPFAQCRFCSNESLHHVIPLSTFRSSFAEDYGVKLVDSILAGLTARAVVVIDEHDRVIYTQLVSELSDEPDYKSALAALTDLQGS
ncbi:MAG: thiol peroxidase, atypical 2-Cys peroxiredoxin [Methylococcaceae bacterium NSP1-2]|nr:thiol peroxidase [Methylococcaceae bacterium]OYV20280.1 MAG: thiol peroxidase, atypical 2-Cys peroxiredoxin [Methylococcaceae bacterium NSP1-2]